MGRGVMVGMPIWGEVTDKVEGEMLDDQEL